MSTCMGGKTLVARDRPLYPCSNSFLSLPLSLSIGTALALPLVCLFVCFFTSSVQLTFISLTLRTPAPAPGTACAEALSNAPEVAAECCENRGTAGTILPTNRWSRWSGKKLDPSTPAPTPLHPSCRESEPSQRRLVVHCLVGKQASSIT